MREEAFFFGVAVGAIAILMLVLLTGGKPRDAWEREAVKAGKAEYYLDENNNKQWRWK